MPPVHGDLAPPAPARAPAGSVPATWTGDPAVWVQIEETLALLPIKRRRLLLNYWASGNIADATRRAGYNVKNVKSACEVGREILRDPKVAWCTRAIFEAECGGAEKLRALLGVHAAGFDSPSEGDRDRSLRAASLIYKHGRPRPVPGSKSPLDQLFDEMAPAELEQFAVHREWPARFGTRLRALGFTRRDDADATETSAETSDTNDGDSAGTDAPVGAPSPAPSRPLRPRPRDPEPDTAARGACGDGDAGYDDAEARTPTMTWAPASHQPTSGKREAERESARSSGSFAPAAARPEDRVWPPIDRPATLADDNRSDEPPPPRDWYKRDWRW
jgi:hypothetical protein